MGRPLTKDHKPESEEEVARFEKSGGKVVNPELYGIGHV
jgi:hypothetical protein